ncbi:MAG TPA: transcription antitermination factor NusB [Candidatus Krumholzibacteria bacterium]|nr:transcription antitermination factor NusB [Candidatus Krumholzibacteria bacterium]
MSADPVRRRALALLEAVENGGHLDAQLDDALAELRAGGAEARDAAFLAELVRGTLQWRLRYDHLVRRYARRNPPTDLRLLCLLRLSLHQLVALDQVPPFAAVHQAGELCKAAVSPRLTGFVNGVLQAARRELRPDETTGPDQRASRLAAAFGDLEAGSPAWLAAWHAHPRWLVDRWVRRFGAEATDALLAFNNRPVSPAFHVLAPHDPAAAADDLAAAGCPVDALGDGRTLVCRERPPRALIASLLQARPWLLVQDPAVQQATGWLMEGIDGAGLPVLDLCAAPGGKTRRLAAAWPGSQVLVAADHRAPRLRLLVEAAGRIDARPVAVVAADGAAPPFRAGAFGVVLLDGPCSGTGVLRHHPDGRLQLKKGAAANNGRLLQELARQAADLLAPGGVLLYATCSLEPEENEQVLDRLLGAGVPLAPRPAADGAWRRTWLPGEAQGDGFFAARLVRTA